MDRELEVIRGQMEETRASLTDKLEALESQVLGTVQSATDTVSSAVEGAKEVVSSVTEGAREVVEKVSETVDTVKETLSVSHYVERYPWASLGVAVAAGFTAAQLLPAGGSTVVAPSRQRAAPPGRSWSSALGGWWQQSASTIEGLAVGTLMSGIKDLLVSNLPQEWHGDLTRVVDDFTTQMGGKVMQGNPMDELVSAFRPQHHNGSQDSPS